jgi:hypothetical protein
MYEEGTELRYSKLKELRLSSYIRKIQKNKKLTEEYGAGFSF